VNTWTQYISMASS